MQNLNLQRKAFLDMLAWSEGTDNGRQPTRNHGYDVIVGGELFTDYSDHPRKLVTLNPKLKSTAAGRYQCSGQQKLATALEFFQYRFSDSFGGNPPLYSCGLSAL